MASPTLLGLLALALPAVASATVARTEAALPAVTPVTNAGVGTSVAIDGDTAVVGARLDDGPVSRSGAAYVFVRSGGVWTLQAKLGASDAGTFDAFGKSVAIDGDSIVVGADRNDDAGTGSGSAYVFTRSGGVWTEQAKLTASDAAEGDFFGVSVGVSGDTVVVGAFYDQDAGFASGSAYVFERTGTAWAETAKLISSDLEGDDYFGYRVAIEGDTILIGVPESDDAGSQSGSAYVFVRAGGIWSEQAKLTASDASAEAFFGTSVGLSGDTAVVGATPLLGAPGSAYVFFRAGTSWSQQAELEGPLGEPNAFGTATISGDTVIVGAARSTASGVDAGAIHVFGRAGGAWTRDATIVATDAGSGDFFGNSVAVAGTTVVVGAPRDAGDPDAGAAYAYELVPGRNVGGSIAIKNAIPDAARRNRLRHVATDPSLAPAAAGSPGDPGCGVGAGGSLVVKSAASGATFSQALPCGRWRVVGAPAAPEAWDYRDPDRVDGPCTRVFVKKGRIRIRCSGRDTSPFGYDLQLGSVETPVTLLLGVGDELYCGRFGGVVKHDGSSGETFDARRAPTTTACE